MRKHLFTTLLLLVALTPVALFAQSEAYQTPPQAIWDIVDAKPVATAILGENPNNQIILNRDFGFLELEDVAVNEYRLAGIRINPSNFSLSRQTYSNEIDIIMNKKKLTLVNLPTNMKISNVKWSPTNKYVVFTNTTPNQVDLWRVSTSSGVAQKINQYPVNVTTLGGGKYLTTNVYQFLDDETIMYPAVPANIGEIPTKDKIATGPAVQEVYGKKFGARTIADIITSPSEEAIFEYLTTVQLVVFSDNGTRKLGEKNIYSQISVSPDKKYVIAKTVQKPYSYITSFTSFPHKLYVMDIENGNIAMNIEDKTVKEDKEDDKKTPKASKHAWRLDQPSTIYWTEKVEDEKDEDEDNDDEKKDEEKEEKFFQTSVYQLTAPFTAKKSLVLTSELAFGSITWGNSTFALFDDSSKKQKIKRLLSFNPSNTAAKPNVLYSVSNQKDTVKNYTVIGTPYKAKNQYGQMVVYLEKSMKNLYFVGANRPDSEGDMMSFVDTFSLKTKKFSQLWMSQPPYATRIVDIENFKTPTVLVSRQSATTPVNFALVNMKTNTSVELTHFVDPTPAIRELGREFVTYNRKDGVEQTALLITPKGYDKDRDGTLPVFMWAYPDEFRTAVEAEKSRAGRYNFIPASSAALVATQGYAVMLDMSMFIISDGKENEPNDVFISEIISSSEAAIDYIVESGIGDKDRIAVGGHSYGAFMTAHLLSQSDLFTAGVARSGAYNRSLTPYGFQSEKRTYWKDPELYFKMSPFSYVDKLKEPILVIHGDLDENNGTFPVQSQRLYQALSFHGATSRYVVLPYETHSYRARESVYQLWWETINWLDKYTKNAEPKEEK